jgi:peptide-methionine (S)-S-oxide reductase
MKWIFLFTFVTVFFASISCVSNKSKPTKQTTTMSSHDLSKYSTAVFGAGCFWCVETQFQLLEGVDTVISGYAGGHVENPTYKEVCTGTTGHAEVCKIYYDSSKISYEDLLQAFFITHDPTQLNRQGNDIGTQYRSVIYYANEQEHQLAKTIIEQLNASKAYDKPIVTELSDLPTFYAAEDYHQNYYNLNGSQPYCAFVIKPKREHFEQVFKNRLKKKAQ